MKNDLLKKYKDKRNFNKTSEPAPSKKNKSSKKLSFVIQEHHARNLHYDFRLEWEGVLKSWAVPKGISLDPKIKRLAIQTEDHPFSYGKFHGTIPKGEYGAGEVSIWDHGTWEPQGNPASGFKKGHLELVIRGEKLKGRWHLIRTNYKGNEKSKTWLLFKAGDEKQVQEDACDPWPGFIPPQFPKLVVTPPSESEWIHELKLDGYRMQAHLKDFLASLLTRNGHDWSNKFPHLLGSLEQINQKSAIFDGEIVALDDSGKSHFQYLQNSLKTKDDEELVYFIFDILYLNGKDLRSIPLFERKRILKEVLIGSPQNIMFSEHFIEKGKDFYDVICQHELEGIVSKLADSHYYSGRNDSWTKSKCSLRQEFVIGGYTTSKSERSGFGALLLGVYDNDLLKYVGKVGSGFNQRSLKNLKNSLLEIAQDDSPFDIGEPQTRGVSWVNPIKLAEVKFSSWTHDGILRCPVFMGMREDKKASGIQIEKSELTSPEKILYSKEKIKKVDVLNYYQSVNEFMIPHLQERPLSLMRCPEGDRGECFYQKHLMNSSSRNLFTGDDYIYLQDFDGLHELIQMNAYEIHSWNCHVDNIYSPDQIVIDFDPGQNISWANVVNGAFYLKDILDELDLKSFVKLTGGKGVHVHIPIASKYDWDSVKAFSQTLALQLVSSYPDLFTANMSKKKRVGKIFVDYLRNGFGATAVAPYSLRAKGMSAVAMPVQWGDLMQFSGANHFTMELALAEILQRKRDPWQEILNMKQDIKVLDASLYTIEATQ